LHVIENKYSKDYASMEDFLCKVGRRKFLMPIYAALCNTEEGKGRAQQIYAKAKPNYHYVSRASIEKLLGLI